MTWSPILNGKVKTVTAENTPVETTREFAVVKKSETTQGVKFDTDKPQMDLLPPRATLLLLEEADFDQKLVLSKLFRFWESGKEKYLEEAIVELSDMCNDNFEGCVNTLEGVAQVLSFGAKKYAAHNWAKGIKLSRNFAATVRHLVKVAQGQDIDPESGLHHYYHALCDMFFMYETLSFKDVADWNDRFKWEERCTNIL